MTAPPRSEITPHLRGWIIRAIEAAPPGHVPLLFLSGPQGAGKSTALAEAISGLPHPVAGASIDDFYLTRAERHALSETISPLYAVRGPPGTHDLSLLRATLTALRDAGPQTTTPIPAFDKLADDRAPQCQWRRFQGRPAAILIEGWLMGVSADTDAPATPPLNAIEAEDKTGAWRRHQESDLAGPYATLWDSADGFFHIKAPDFGCVLHWRLEQEAALWQARGEAMPADREHWTSRFIQHYERLTRRMIDGHHRPGTELRIDAQRRVV